MQSEGCARVFRAGFREQFCDKNKTTPLPAMVYESRKSLSTTRVGSAKSEKLKGSNKKQLNGRESAGGSAKWRKVAKHKEKRIIGCCCPWKAQMLPRRGSLEKTRAFGRAVLEMAGKRKGKVATLVENGYNLQCTQTLFV